MDNTVIRARVYKSNVAAYCTNCTSNPKLPLREPSQLAIPSPPNQIILFTSLRHSGRDSGSGGVRYAIFRAGLAADEDAFRFDASSPTPPWFAVTIRRLCAAKAGIDEEILQHVVQRRADVLSRDPCGMREAPRRTEQHVCLSRGYSQSQKGRLAELA